MEMAMLRIRFLIAFVLAALVPVSACATRPLPAVPTGITFQPGRYVTESYFAPGFKPGEVSYVLAPFPVAAARDADAQDFLKLFQEELSRAWQAQGLQLGPGENACRLAGTIHHLAVRGARLRLVTGRVHAELTISGNITQEEEVLFAFRDRVAVSSPLAPGPAVPKERELLLHQLARETVHHLLNELLLHGEVADSG